MLYSVFGLFIYHDFFWMINQNPYKGAAEIYGHGGLLHFVKHYRDIWDLPVTLFLISGSVAFIADSFKFPSYLKSNYKRIFIYSFFAVFFMAHTFFWWKGLFGSIGTIRVIGSVVPVTAIMCLDGLNFWTRRMTEKTRPYVVVVSLIAMLFGIVVKEVLPVRLNTEDKVVKESAEWIQQSKLEEHKLYYFSPYFSLFLNRDIYDTTRNEEPWGIHDKQYRNNIPTGSLLIWDSHFSANEGRMSLIDLIADENFRVLNKFKSEKLWTDLNKQKKYFEIYIFQKK
jgi:hypothetical protein